MSAAIRQIVTVKQGGVVELCSPQLYEGDRAEVTVVVVRPSVNEPTPANPAGWRRFAGIFHGGDARAGDNQRIDADLAAEYGNQAKSEP